METESYREALQPQEADFTEWETSRLRDHIGGLLVAAEFANLRRYGEVEREIRIANFELCRRRVDYERFQERLAQQAGQAALAGGPGC